ncbi:MAG: hypothetical protein NXH75_00030 [Halobacteriovoraceae bacterium]|nr:hypothetical protein [Halobacteriovoraceae bacterium]
MRTLLLRIFQKIAIGTSVVLPRSIQLGIYRFCFSLFRRFISGEKGTLWFRNSLYFDEIVFGVSDIDMTFFQESGQSTDQVKKIEKTLSRLKWIIPILGEINYYSPDSFSDFLPLANPYELKRDPRFLLNLKKLNFDSHLSLTEKSDRQAFVLNWLATDSHRLRENFKFRKLKIQRFLRLLDREELSDKCKDLSDLILIISENFFEGDNKKVCEFLTDFTYLNFTNPDSLNSFYRDTPENRTLFMCLYPQKWLGASLHHQSFEEDIKQLTAAPDYLQAIFLKQIRWEAWGLLSQWMRSKDDINFHLHVENLLRAVNVFENKADIEKKALTKLSELHEVKFYPEECHAC